MLCCVLSRDSSVCRFPLVICQASYHHLGLCVVAVASETLGSMRSLAEAALTLWISETHESAQALNLAAAPSEISQRPFLLPMIFLGAALGLQRKALCLLGKLFTAELNPQPLLPIIFMKPYSPSLCLNKSRKVLAWCSVYFPYSIHTFLRTQNPCFCC